MKNVLRSMKLWQKFAVLGVIGTTMCAVPLWQVTQARNGEIAVAVGEKAGVEPVRTAVALQQHLQMHRLATAAWLAGGSGADSERRNEAAAVNAEFQKLGQQLAGLGYTKAIEAHKAAKAQWDTLTSKLDAKALDAAASKSAHGDIIAANVTLVDHIADGSGLSLDPVAESYYMMTAAVDHLPRLAEAVEDLHMEGVAALGAVQDAVQDVGLELVELQGGELLGEAVTRLGLGHVRGLLRVGPRRGPATRRARPAGGYIRARPCCRGRRAPTRAARRPRRRATPGRRRR